MAYAAVADAGNNVAELKMADDDNDPLSDDDNAALDDFDELCDRLFQVVSQFADEEGVDDELLPLLLLRLSVTTRMMAYVGSVAKPSGGGLKLALDRYRRETDDLIRDAKKDADRSVAAMKAALDAAGSDQDDNEDEA